jgi:hypothetical protein
MTSHAPRPVFRKAVSLLEVLIVGVIATILAVPILSSISLSGHEAMTSEDYMLAEALCERYVQEALGLPWAKLAGSLPIRERLSGIPPGDEQIARRFPEYRQNVAEGDTFRGELSIQKVEEGLLMIEAHLEWPVRPGSKTMRSFSLIRMKSRWDLTLGRTWPLSKGTPLSLNEDDKGDPR